jgi:tetratricopeptide (TPR) repeat protein
MPRLFLPPTQNKLRLDLSPLNANVMDRNTDNLKKFVEKALRIQAQNQSRLSEAEKKEIAESLGFSQADWQAVLDSFAGHLARGKAFLERNNYTQAIAELEEALILQPEHPDTLAYAASAYLGLYQHKKKKMDQEKAIQYAKDCLLLQPQHPLAHQVLDAFNPTKIPSNLQALLQAKEASRQKPQQTSAKSPSTDRSKPLREVAIFASVMAGIGLLFWLSFPSKSPQTKPAAPSAPAVVSSSSPREKTTNRRYERALEPQPLPLELIGSSTGWQAIPQNPNTWLIQDAKGKALFNLQSQQLQWVKEIHSWQDQTWKGRKKYNFYSKGTLLLKVSSSQLSTSVRFSAKLVKANGLNFYSDFKTQTIGLNLMPFNLRIPQDHWLLLPFQISTLQKGLSFEEELPFALTEIPAKLQIELGKEPASPMASELGAPLPVFYQGKPYSELSLRPLGQATGWSLDSIFSYRWAFSLKHQNGNRQLKGLKLRILFFDRENRSIATYTEGWSSSEAWAADFPPLPAGQAALQGFMHDLKGIASAEEVVRKEVVIEELIWD